ncbi:DNA polymerase III subunit alpha [Candidatus Vesicomyidisocius calyptogenae]|uniref:DNA polymerase III subunit alpha n=1 Tax=Vesicomyosocius okutanii subsp. Calyptogena okutanii (strain HA) TaxID=412965 RepID=A5CW17_VESOH|nr:DNA polymerase III subunit alpha [Candidatus Vesicomyosocius okutanii]BAF61840.1 DNA polymerase III alpha subunit [Candidatus Vesicomyosocius okutanii]
MVNPGFVHLHCQSEFSVENSVVRISKFIEKVQEIGMDSIALTDESNLFAAVKFYQKATAANIKPIFGARINIKDKEGELYSGLLLCQDHQGYLNLSELISLSYTQGRSCERVSITQQELIDYNQGLIMIATPIYSDVAKYLISNKIVKAKQKSEFWQAIFVDRYYLGVQRTSRKFDEKHLHLCIKLALELGIAVVATNDVQFLNESDFDAHEARICISQGSLLDDTQRKRHFSNQQFLKSPKQMYKLFSDLPEILENTLELAKRCNVHFELFKKNYLPDFPIPEHLTIEQFFSEESEGGLVQRLKNLKVDVNIYQQRLKFELDIIIQMGFSGYFLIVADFIKWSKENDIPVGPGRGSGAGSLVAYVLGITNVDPIKHELLFERFLNPERVSMPDLDIDFCTDRRDEVIGYVAKRYGHEKVSQIITYGTMAAKGVVRDVGRVLGHPYGFSDQISKMIPNDLRATLEKALSEPEKGGSKELRARYDSEESVTALIDLSKQLEGLVRNVGTHAGGVVIAPSKISDFCPVYKGYGENNSVVSQFDKDDVEAVGLVKFDFLGLSNLTVIHKAIKLISVKGLSDEPINLDALPLDDKRVYKLLQSCDTTGVFQLESKGMRSYLKKLQADNFEDIVAMLALYRPGPLDAGMVDDYINVKHGAQVKYPHPMLEQILKPTNGVFLYQEQVMKSAQVMAGYSLGGADLLRRAMGKKKASEMNRQRSVFVKGAAERGINEKKANEIFDLIDKFSGYGFNKSHSVAYAYVSYHTAWLKSHYPAPFMAAVLSGVMDDTDRVSFTISEIRQMGLIVNGPNVCESNYEFSILDKNTVLYGLGAIKGVGVALVDAVVFERSTNGTYKDLFEFCSRIEKRYLNKRAIEALIYSGAFDILGVNRESLIKTYPIAIRQAEQKQSDYFSGQNGLFSHNEYETRYLLAPSFSFKKRLQLEKSVLGYYFDNHPTNEYTVADLKNINVVLPSNIVFRKNRDVRVLALISDLRYRSIKNGERIALITIEDGSASLNAVVFTKTLTLVSNQLMTDEVVVISGKINKDFRDQWQLVVNKIENIEQVKISYAKGFEVLLNTKHQSIFDKLIKILIEHKGNCPVKISYIVDNLRGSMLLNKVYLVAPNQQLIDAVNILAQDQVSKVYYH